MASIQFPLTDLFTDKDSLRNNDLSKELLDYWVQFQIKLSDQASGRFNHLKH